MTQTQTSFTFNIFLEQQEGHLVGHCLEMGLVAVHPDQDELISIMSRLVTRQLQFALENDNPADIYHSAPADVWERFRQHISERESVPERSQKHLRAQGWPQLTVDQFAYACA